MRTWMLLLMLLWSSPAQAERYELVDCSRGCKPLVLTDGTAVGKFETQTACIIYTNTERRRIADGLIVRCRKIGTP